MLFKVHFTFGVLIAFLCSILSASILLDKCGDFCAEQTVSDDQL